MMTKYMKHCFAAFILACGLVATTACSDSYMEELNTDETKSPYIDPNSQLTTSLLQTYGDFSMMDTYRSYITGFTQHFAGGWNVTNYAGSVNAVNSEMSHVWQQLYAVGVKNIVDAIANSADMPNVNAALRIHKVYIMSVLTDIYGDIPCEEAGQAYIKGIATPKFDKQEDIYNYFFDELAACVEQLGTGNDHISGDVTSMNGDTDMWKKYANSLRMRYAMRISDVNPTKAREEFEKAMAADGGYITTAADDAYIIYTDSPFTLYDGARDLDFRVNALGEILYGQDPTSPTFVCATLFNLMQENNDPRLYRICRHYINTKRAEVKPDREWNVDVTDEVIEYLKRAGEVEQPCNPGAAWYNNWVNAPATNEIPTLQKLVNIYPEAGFEGNNYPARMMRPFLSIDFEMPDRPGFLVSSAEVQFLLAEAKSKGWAVSGDVETHFTNGVKAAMQMLNTHYLQADRKIADSEVNKYIAAQLAKGTLAANPREAINTEAWILHMMNPNEAWANLRRADYPVMMDRSKLDKFDGFNYDSDLTIPTRLRYPTDEHSYNKANYDEAVMRMDVKDSKGTYEDNWHHRLWWDTADINVK